jgi:hypothetical protein
MRSLDGPLHDECQVRRQLRDDLAPQDARAAPAAITALTTAVPIRARPTSTMPGCATMAM